MNQSDFNALSPLEAAFIAHNSYFALKDWVTGTPTKGIEATGTVSRMVIGDGVPKNASPNGTVNTSLATTKLRGANLHTVFSGSTAGLTTGFGYVLTFSRNGRKHAVVAARGTRAEH